MVLHQSKDNALEWRELIKFPKEEIDLENGPNNSYSKIRLFGTKESSVRVTLYRDYHAWCPYCQKVWLWLELKKIPYKVKKITMRCYGEKEKWYVQKVPSGLLPALEIDNNLITESDEIILQLEKSYGPLGQPFESKSTIQLRHLERKLFRSWCIWLCNTSFFEISEERRKNEFLKVAEEFDQQLATKKGTWLDQSSSNNGNYYPGSGDIIFIPYLERMSASLCYYKGFILRERFKNINNWLSSLEKLSVYQGTQGDFHTHAHDLPPQMGRCCSYDSPSQREISVKIDRGEGLGDYEYSQDLYEIDPKFIALQRVLKHRDTLLKVNPLGEEKMDQPLRAALTYMINQKHCLPNSGSAIGLRYLRDRISVPRDMPILAARKLRQALEATANLDSELQGPSIPLNHRLDQNPKPFI